MSTTQSLRRFMIFLALSLFCVQGCSGGSSGGGGPAIAPVNTAAASTTAPIPSGSSMVDTGLGLQGNEGVFPDPLSSGQYLMTRSGYANLHSGTVTWHPQNGAVLHVTAFDDNTHQGDSVAWLQLLEISVFDALGNKSVVHHEDFRTRSLNPPISGAWYAHQSGMWFAQQVTNNSGTFGSGRHSSYGVPMWLSDPFNPERRHQAAHLWITPFPRVRITSGEKIQIRAKFVVYGGALFYFGLDRWPTTTDTANSQTQAQAKVEQVMLSQTYDSRGAEAHYDIRIESPLRVLPAGNSNPPKQDPQPGLVTPITHAVLGTP